MQKLHMGIDVGSTTVKAVVRNDDGKIIFSSYERHFSDIIATVKELFEKAEKVIGDNAVTVVITGSGGLLISEMLKIKFVQEVIATKTAVSSLYPDIDVVIELGGEDAKILYLSNGLEQRMNGTCAGGTGSFIDQMAILLKTDASGLNDLAENHQVIYPIAARCGVFAKSDIQPLLNEGATKEDVAASVLQAVVTQTISGLAQGRPIKGNVLFLGGPLHYLSQLRTRFEETLKENVNSFRTPDNGQLFVSMGASMMHDGDEYTMRELIEKLDSSKGTKQQITRMDKLFESEEAYNEFKKRHDSCRAERFEISEAKGELFLGMDVGSTTLKAVLCDKNGRICYDRYEKNNGSPLTIAVEFLKEIYSLLPEGAFIANAAATGYGEQLCKVAFSIPEGEIETIAHYKAAGFFVPDVDFIIDIGGQDMKCMKMKNGVIESIMLNEACSSGCGSFIHTFAESLGLTAPEFAKTAISAENPVDLGTRCTVFMNSRVKQAQKEGAQVGDISAGLSYSVVRNALYKVIKLRDTSLLGKNIVVQGGTFYNDAVLRCFELVSERNVIRPDIAGIMGAFGAALIARDRYNGVPCNIISRDELESFSFENKLTRCKGCQNKCRLTITRFADGRSFVSGNRCEKGAGKTEVSNKLPNMYEYKYNRVFDYTPLDSSKAKYGVIGIPRVLNIYENYPLWHTFLTELGFSVQLSGRSTHSIYEKGIDSIPSESACYPAKLAHGHIRDLLDREIMTIFYPCVTYEEKEYDGAGNHFNCPMVVSYPQVIYNNVDDVRKEDMKFIFPFVNLNDRKSFNSQMYKEFSSYGITKAEIERASEAAFAELSKFKADIRRKSEEIIKLIESEKIHGIVLAGRPYHIDPEINHGIPELINSLGFAVLCEDGIAHLGKLKRDIRVVDQWAYHTRLYEAAAYVAKNPRLELIQLNSFGCGLDAVTTDQVMEILEAKQKIYTTLKIDEISNLGTAKIRIRSLKAAVEERENTIFDKKNDKSYTLERNVFDKEDKKNHTIIFPQMSPFHFKMFEASLKKEGYKAMLLEKVDASDVEMGLKCVNNDACYPSIIVTGQLINALVSGKVDPENCSVMITQTGGGCRATNYIAFIRKALKEMGFDKIPVISLNISGLEGNPGFKLTVPLVHNLVRSAVLGDILISLTLATRPYEVNKGDTDKLLNTIETEICNDILNGRSFNVRKKAAEIISRYENIEIRKINKPKVGLVGEILVKFHPDANNECIRVIESEGGEAVMPGIADFLLYCLYNTKFRRDNLGFSKKATAGCEFGIYLIEKYRDYACKALLKSERYKGCVPAKIADIAKGAEKILKLGHCSGEGWFLTGEMIELIEGGAENIICVQPFACLPNHVTGKGMIKEIRRQFPRANIVPIDYDPGASEVNQLNRIKLMMATAFDNAKKKTTEAKEKVEV